MTLKTKLLSILHFLVLTFIFSVMVVTENIKLGILFIVFFIISFLYIMWRISNGK